MNFSRRFEEVAFHEENRGAIFRTASYAGIAASWALKEEFHALNAQLIWAIIFFALYLAADAFYAHQVALTERAELLKQEDKFVKENGRPPKESDAAPYCKSEVSCSEYFSKYKPLIVAAGYLSLIWGAKEVLAKLG